jgi:hypothetical protein
MAGNSHLAQRLVPRRAPREEFVPGTTGPIVQLSSPWRMVTWGVQFGATSRSASVPINGVTADPLQLITSS